jgi:hypothetical protein
MSDSKTWFIRYLKRLGAGSMFISIIIHVIILSFATLWVVSSVRPQRKAQFRSGDGGTAEVSHPVRMSPTQPRLENFNPRLSVDSATADVALPDLPSMQPSGGSPALNAGSAAAGFGTGPSLKGPIMPAFGFRDSALSGGSLIGRLYDLKQTPQRKPTGMDLPSYGKVVDEYLSKRWDTAVLNRYYTGKEPIFTTQIFIPLLKASEGPKAFGQEKEVAPELWLIHYKGKVSAPTSGTWRFWGYGGEVCAVAIDRKTVLVSNHPLVLTPRTNWESPEPPGRVGGSGRLVAGDWIDLRVGQFVDIDILIGERGGFTFDCFLLIEKRGESYGTKDGLPLFPIFQLAPYDTPAVTSSKLAPAFSKESVVWRALPPSRN